MELVDSIHAQNPPHLAEVRDESAKVKGKASKLHFIRGPICTVADDNPFELRKHPEYRLLSSVQNSESVEAEEDTS